MKLIKYILINLSLILSVWFGVYQKNIFGLCFISIYTYLLFIISGLSLIGVNETSKEFVIRFRKGSKEIIWSFSVNVCYSFSIAKGNELCLAIFFLVMSFFTAMYYMFLNEMYKEIVFKIENRFKDGV